MTNKKINKTKSQRTKIFLLLASLLLALVVIIASLSVFRTRIESMVMVLLVAGLYVSSLAPAYYSISSKTPKLLRIAGIIALATLFTVIGLIVTAVISVAYISL